VGTRIIERQVRRVASARYVTVGLAITFLGLAFIGAVVMRLVDPDNFRSFGSAVWWALQTVTTVGYGDVVPTTATGRVVGGLEMALGVSFIAFLTAGVTSTVIQRVQAETAEADRAERAREAQEIMAALDEVRRAIADLERRRDAS
jgi:voltage-gated potassium channel